MTGKRIARKEWLGLLLILVAAATLRVQHIRADPPALIPAVSGSAGIYFDEGIYCHNARNKVLFGQWITDEWNPIVYNAPLTLLYFIAFKAFGVSIVTVKGLSILFGLLGILLFFIGVRAYLGPAQALAVSALFSLDFYGLMYNRIGLLENFSSLCFLASFALFATSRGRPRSFFFLGMTAAVAALSKYLFAFFPVAAGLAVAYDAAKRKKLGSLAAFAAGGFAVGLPWFLGIYLPFRPTFGRIGAGWGMLSLPRSIGQAWSNLVHNPMPRYLQLAPAAALILALFGGLILWKVLRLKKDAPEPVDVFVLLWVLGGILSMGFLNYRPLRYYVPVFPAFYLAGSILLRDRERLRESWRSFWPPALVSVALMAPVFKLMGTRPSGFFTFPGVMRGIVFLSFAAALAFFLVRAPSRRPALGAVLLALLCVAPGFLYIRHFYLTPTYDLERASRFFGTLPPGSVVLGQEAPRLTLETRFKALLAYENWFNDRDTFTRFKPTHLVVLDRFGGAEEGWIRRRYPEKAALFEPVRKFQIWDTTMTLFRVPE